MTSTFERRSLLMRALRFIFVWPIILMWRLVTLVANAMGIVFSLVVGIGAIFLGQFLALAGLGLLGLFLVVFGGFLILRALY